MELLNYLENSSSPIFFGLAHSNDLFNNFKDEVDEGINDELLFTNKLKDFCSGLNIQSYKIIRHNSLDNDFSLVFDTKGYSLPESEKS